MYSTGAGLAAANRIDGVLGLVRPLPCGAAVAVERHGTLSDRFPRFDQAAVVLGRLTPACRYGCLRDRLVHHAVWGCLGVYLGHGRVSCGGGDAVHNRVDHRDSHSNKAVVPDRSA